MKFDSLKEKFNYYRGLTDYLLMPNGYVMVMLDGRSFSKKVKKRFKRPFDDVFINIMNETAKYVCKNVSGCKLAYVQSDEINIIIHDSNEQEPFFGNRLCKFQSVIASMATSKFNQLALLNHICDIPCSKDDIVQMISETPLYEFDCKAWNVPNANDAFASILYRQNDCTRNSKSAVAQYFFSHKQLNGKECDEQIQMVKDEIGIDWNKDYDDGKKYGRFIIKIPFVGKSEQDGNTFMRTKWMEFNAKPLQNELIANNMIDFILGKQNNFIKDLSDDYECITETD